MPPTKSISLSADGVYLYTGIIHLAPRADLSRVLPLPKLLSFIDAGNDLFIVADTRYSSYTARLSESIGIDLDTATKRTTDHNHIHALDDGSHTYIRAGRFATSLFTDLGVAPGEVAFRGPGATLFSNNELVDAFITGSKSAYSTDGKRLTRVPRVAGHAAVLAAGLSSRTGGRCVYWGSFEAISDIAYGAVADGHKRVMERLVGWFVGDFGVLKVGGVRHGVVEADRTEYRVKDVLWYEIDILVWNSGKWEAFDADDVQVEFTMLNPWVRTRLVSGGNGTFRALVHVPDQIGVYKFTVAYHRPGFTGLTREDVVPVRPFWHNEYERFIAMAVPYYVSCFSMIGGVFLMAGVVLFGGVQPGKKKTE